MNCLYITLFFNLVAGIVRSFIKSWNQLLYPRVIEVCRLLFAPRHDFFLHLIVVGTFSQRDVSLGEGTSGNSWARGPDCTADGPVYPTSPFALRNRMTDHTSHLVGLWDGAAISNMSHSNEAVSATVKQARPTGKG
jgi:hypothetical protein